MISSGCYLRLRCTNSRARHVGLPLSYGCDTAWTEFPSSSFYFSEPTRRLLGTTAGASQFTALCIRTHYLTCPVSVHLLDFALLSPTIRSLGTLQSVQPQVVTYCPRTHALLTRPGASKLEPLISLYAHKLLRCHPGSDSDGATTGREFATCMQETDRDCGCLG
jgi:hypothetical protein